MQLVRKEISPSNQMSDKEYRNLRDRLSYSAQKIYVQSRQKFYKEFILGEYVKKEDTLATLLGGLVHIILADKCMGIDGHDITCNAEFNAKYTLTQIDPPVGQMGELCEELVNRTRQSIDGGGIQTDSFNVIFKDAVDAVKYEFPGSLKELKFVGKSLETILDLFVKPDKKGNIPENYYKEALKTIDKKLISIRLIEQAEKLVTQLKEHPYTRDIIGLESDENTEIFNELIVLYKLEELDYRSMIDKVVICHKTKTIQMYDYKCTYDVENGFEYSYLKYGYWLQVGLYSIAVKEWAIEHGIGDYQIMPLRYIAVDTTGSSAPAKYYMTEKDVLMAQRGYSVRGKKYPGVLSVHKDIQWNLNTGIWNSCEKIHSNNGVAELGLIYR